MRTYSTGGLAGKAYDRNLSRDRVAFKTYFQKEQPPKRKGTRIVNGHGDIAELSSVEPPKDLFEIVYGGFLNAYSRAKDYFKTEESPEKKTSLAGLVSDTLLDSADRGDSPQEAIEKTRKSIDDMYDLSLLHLSLARYKQAERDYTHATRLMEFFDRILEREDAYDVGDELFEHKGLPADDLLYLRRMVEVVNHARSLIEAVEIKYHLGPVSREKMVAFDESAKSAYDLVYRNISDTTGMDPRDFAVCSFGGIALGFVVPDELLHENAIGETEGIFSMNMIQGSSEEDILHSDYARDLGLVSFRMPKSLDNSRLEQRVTMAHELHHIKEKYINHDLSLKRDMPGSMNAVKIELAAEMASNPPSRIYLGSGFEEALIVGDPKVVKQVQDIPDYIKNILERGIQFKENGRPDDKAGMVVLAHMISMLKDDSKLPEMLRDFDRYMEMKR